MRNRTGIIPVILVLVLSLVLSVPVFAAPGIEITRQPQNATYPEGSVAYYTVEAYGSNLTYTWCIVFDGKVYDTSKALSGQEKQPWSGYVTEGFGTNETGNHFYFQGILPELSGAMLFCNISDGQQTVQSDVAYISVGGSAMPPELVVPASMTVGVGTPVDLYCAATTYDGSAVEYLWYETSSGYLEDIMAINRGAETQASLHCDTNTLGTRYYACLVTTGNGGSAYTNVIPLNVVEMAEEAPADSSSGKAVLTPADSSSGSGKGPDATVSSGGAESTDATVSQPATAEKDKGGIAWWMIALPTGGAFVLGGCFVLYLTKRMMKKMK